MFGYWLDKISKVAMTELNNSGKEHAANMDYLEKPLEDRIILGGMQKLKIDKDKDCGKHKKYHTLDHHVLREVSTYNSRFQDGGE